MRNLKLTIEYDGTDFSGWQVQPKKRTVQGEIHKALKTIFNKKLLCIGSGRTDTGVHAQGQVGNVQLESAMPVEEIARALNGNLPRDISILKVEEVPLKFHAQFDARRKTYRYTVLNRGQRGAVDRRFCVHIPHKLDLKNIRKEAQSLIGTHDFRSFAATDPAFRGRMESKDTVRRLYRLDIVKKEPYILFELEANGFLYKMVRNIVGTLLEAGRGELPKGDIGSILKAKDRRMAGMTAPAHGLCLVRVDYTQP